MTAEEAIPALRETIAELQAGGLTFEPSGWAIVVCTCTQAEGMLVACALGTRLAHGPGAFPCGTFLLRQLPAGL